MKELLEAAFTSGTRQALESEDERIYLRRTQWDLHHRLQKTLKLFKEAMRFVGEMASKAKRSLCRHQAPGPGGRLGRGTRCQMYFVNQRWLGGLLTNHITIQKSIKRLKELDALATESLYQGRSKKEITRLERERKHLQQNLAGIKDMPASPTFFSSSTPTGRDRRAEAASWASGGRRRGHQLRPRPGGLPIAGNDDALRAIRLFSSKIADASSKAAPWRPSRSSPPRRSSATKRRSRIFRVYPVRRPRYSEQLMSESLPDEICPRPRCPQGARLETAARSRRAKRIRRTSFSLSSS